MDHNRRHALIGDLHRGGLTVLDADIDGRGIQLVALGCIQLGDGIPSILRIGDADDLSLIHISSKFITHKKTLSLIKKIEKLASIHSAQLLNRQVFVKNRIKTMNESIYYNVDEIHNGISSNRKIRFLYFEYNVAKERVYRHGGAYYVVSPFAMTWDDENYYMVAFDSAAGIINCLLYTSSQSTILPAMPAWLVTGSHLKKLQLEDQSNKEHSKHIICFGTLPEYLNLLS